MNIDVSCFACYGRGRKRKEAHTMKYIQYRMTTNKPEHSDVLAFYDVETKTIIENRGASETAKIIQLFPDRIR